MIDGILQRDSLKSTMMKLRVLVSGKEETRLFKVSDIDANGKPIKN